MLRSIDERDLPQLLEWRNDLRKYFREYRLLSIVDQARWYEAIQGDSTQAYFAITEQGELVGCCGLTNIDWKNRSAEISLYVGGSYIDDKIAPEALKDLMAYGFDDCGLHRLWVEVFDYDNEKTKLVETLDFAKEGALSDTYYKQGKFHSSTIYSYLETVWRSA